MATMSSFHATLLSRSTSAMPLAKRMAAPVTSFSMKRALGGRAMGFRLSKAMLRKSVVTRAEAEDKKKIVQMEAEMALPKEEKIAAPSTAASGTVVMPGDYRIGGILLTVSVLLGPGFHLWTQFFLHAFLGGFLTFQASRVRFRFTDTDLQVVFITPFGSDEEALNVGVDTSGDNKLQGGGENSWPLSSITNWEFWWPGFPVLVYYKETHTKADGQPHFFPIIMDGKKLYETMLERMPESMNAKVSPADWNLQTALEATPIGRQILENLDDEQKATVKGLTGLPFFDDNTRSFQCTINPKLARLDARTSATLQFTVVACSLTFGTHYLVVNAERSRALFWHTRANAEPTPGPRILGVIQDTLLTKTASLLPRWLGTSSVPLFNYPQNWPTISQQAGDQSRAQLNPRPTQPLTNSQPYPSTASECSRAQQLKQVARPWLTMASSTACQGMLGCR
eukprot:1193769-Prorocentrum_minimum.AAC.2